MWGGARPGAGRKAKGDKRVVLSCRVTPQTRDKVLAIAGEMGVGVGNVLDFVLEDYEKRVTAE